MESRPLLGPIPDLGRRVDRRESQPLRLFRALAELIAEEGWGAVTVAKIASRAGVSTRAFYEHFADKEACLIATYDEMTATAIGHIGLDLPSDTPWRERVKIMLERWFKLLANEPHFTRIYALEIWSISRATRARARSGTRTTLVEGLRMANLEAHAEDASVDVLDEEELQMLAGGIHRLVVLATIDGRIGELRTAAPAAIRFAVAGVSRRSGFDSSSV
jgi:AcrR family transcriptional regulator